MTNAPACPFVLRGFTDNPVYTSTSPSVRIPRPSVYDLKRYSISFRISHKLHIHITHARMEALKRASVHGLETAQWTLVLLALIFFLFSFFIDRTLVITHIAFAYLIILLYGTYYQHQCIVWTIDLKLHYCTKTQPGVFRREDVQQSLQIDVILVLC
ncbi:hypothetical protein R3P38DRAFT_460399 [Favolaschia claudopus]|uniref:Uncharacterized protein n=1 Tax=Favolaschia claudopus TaxID=2862362 RepID=A0AAV9ZF64_9AGAR